jgi:hypothetical protein
MLNTEKKKQLVEHGTRLLKAFHDANDRNPNGLESASWRGRFAEFRSTIGIVAGPGAASEVLEILREENGIPHVGPVMDDGTIYGMDLEANPHL